MVLTTLVDGRSYAYRIARSIEETTGHVLRIEDGSLYPALQRLERLGCVRAAWGFSDHDRRVCYYAITPAGRRYLRREASTWLQYTSAVQDVLMRSSRVR